MPGLSYRPDAVTKKHPGPSAPPPKVEPKAEPKYSAIFLRAPEEVDLAPPPLANEVTVAGGIDCVVVEMFYVPQGRYADALLAGTAVEPHRDPRIGILRSPPVARCAISFTTAAELVAKLVEAAADGAGELKSFTPDIVDRINAALLQVSLASPPSETPAPPPVPQEDS